LFAQCPDRRLNHPKGSGTEYDRLKRTSVEGTLDINENWRDLLTFPGFFIQFISIPSFGDPFFADADLDPHSQCEFSFLSQSLIERI
jgi:hypothetical protein